MAGRTVAPVRTFGTGPGADVRFEQLRVDELGRPGFDLVATGERAPVQLRLVGEHHAANAAAAAAVALGLGMSLGSVTTALADATTLSRGRMEVSERADGVTVIDDAYNANPDSMRAALKALADIGRGRPAARTVAVLGEMRELGAGSRDEHDAVGRLVVRLDIDQLLVVGDPAKPLHLGACLEGSWGGESVFVADNDAATAWLHEHLAPGDVVLFKASNAAQLGQVAAAVLADAPSGQATRPASSSPWEEIAR
jgi:UDP-N-acetylmuramoyl-tripeptide--D-alanyl-D-alanine ligase